MHFKTLHQRVTKKILRTLAYKTCLNILGGNKVCQQFSQIIKKMPVNVEILFFIMYKYNVNQKKVKTEFLIVPKTQNSSLHFLFQFNWKLFVHITVQTHLKYTEIIKISSKIKSKTLLRTAPQEQTNLDGGAVPALILALASRTKLLLVASNQVSHLWQNYVVTVTGKKLSMVLKINSNIQPEF